MMTTPTILQQWRILYQSAPTGDQPESDFTDYTLTEDSFYWFCLGTTNINIFFETSARLRQNVSAFETKRLGVYEKRVSALAGTLKIHLLVKRNTLHCKGIKKSGTYKSSAKHLRPKATGDLCLRGYGTQP